MKEISTLAGIRRWRQTVNGRVVLVPTMGALHRGHGDLIKAAGKRAGKSGHVVVSIFVNPTQFGEGEDFTSYPRPLAADRRLCRSLGADVLFVPDAKAMYSPSFSTGVEETVLSTTLCGKARPGHFRGVCTVVAKLFHLVGPDLAVFGEKDFQQIRIIRRMVEDLNFPVTIIGHPTVREADGLALSSRNQYLTPAERVAAPRLYEALHEAKERFQRGENRSSVLKELVRRRLKALPEARMDYVELVDGDSLQPVSKVTSGCILAATAFFGRARLIDHVTLSL